MLLSKIRSSYDFKAFWLKYKHFSLLSIYGLCQIWFMYCEKTLHPKYFMYSPIDSYIPFIKLFIIPYLFWFVYMGIGFLYLGLVSKKDYYRLCIFMFGGMCICYIIYMIFPNAQNLRPVITEDDIFSKTIQLIYATDTNTNVSPSIHVFNSIAVHVALFNCSAFKKEKKFWSWASFIIMISICLSTVFIKQHSIKDAMWATVLASVLYLAIYRLPKLVSSNNFSVSRTKQITME